MQLKKVMRCPSTPHHSLDYDSKPGEQMPEDSDLHRIGIGGARGLFAIEIGIKHHADIPDKHFSSTRYSQAITVEFQQSFIGHFLQMTLFCLEIAREVIAEFGLEL